MIPDNLAEERRKRSANFVTLKRGDSTCILGGGIESTLMRYFEKKGVDVKSFSTYSAVNELHLINNCIKHSGIVDERLSKKGRWKKGQRIKIPNQKFFRLGRSGSPTHGKTDERAFEAPKIIRIPRERTRSFYA